MLDQINLEIKSAMKAKQKLRLEALRYLKSMLMENQTSKSPKAELDVVVSHNKKLKDSLVNYPSESEMHQKILKEIDVVKEFLPKQLTEDEVLEIIKNIAAKLDSPNMGGIMKELSPSIKGKFDGKKASSLVKNFLG